MRACACADAPRTPPLNATQPAAAETASACRREIPCSPSMASPPVPYSYRWSLAGGDDRPRSCARPVRPAPRACAGRAAEMLRAARQASHWEARSGFALRKPPTRGIQMEGFHVGGTAMIRATVLRALVLTAAFAAALTPVTCLGEDSNRLPTKATKELPPELLSLLRQKKMPKHSPILVRLFKEEAELEVWKQDTTGRFQLLKIYPICRWSGDLGPKLQEGDRQAPEGFYAITPGLMNPNSNFYLAINIGYPNSFDKANNRDGSLLMIHGDCSSSGCYAMTDEQISEIYSLARDSFLGGRPSFQVQAYPFRLTPANLARHRNNPNL